jgi:hypothetical protein
MKIYVVSSEFTVFTPSTDYTGSEDQRTQTDIEKCFKSEKAAENYIHNRITLAENMCMQNPTVHQGFVRSQWGCNWLDLYQCFSGTLRQRYFVSYSIKELEL